MCVVEVIDAKSFDSETLLHFTERIIKVRSEKCSVNLHIVSLTISAYNKS